MTIEHDVVIAGAGHNGLALAGYLSKAGLDVCVLEKNAWVGGGCVTMQKSAPGFHDDPASTAHIFIQANPMIADDELGLKRRYGLKYRYPEAPYAVVYPDDSSYICYRDVDRTCASIERSFSARSADAYRRFHDWTRQGLDALVPTMFSPCMSVGELFGMLSRSDHGRVVLQSLMMSTLQLLDSWFDDEKLKIAIARFTTEVIVAPQEAGTGMFLYMMTPFVHRYGLGVPEGGSGALTEKLAACVRDQGGTIRVEEGVRHIKVEGGRARGVVLESGDEVVARRAVVSALNARQLFLQLLPSDVVPGDLANRIRQVKMNSFQPFHQMLAMHEAPKYKAGDEVNKAFAVEFAPARMAEFRQQFEDYSAGKVRSDGLLMATQTLFDPTRAPPGKHTGYLFHYAPYHLKDGAGRWGAVGGPLADDVLAHLRRHTTNMGDENIIGRTTMTPLDYEQWNASFIQGEAGHVGNYLFQMFDMRPVAGWGHYKTPIEKLYMTGSSTHPGGGITGGSGRAAAQVVCADLGIDFERLKR